MKKTTLPRHSAPVNTTSTKCQKTCNTMEPAHGGLTKPQTNTTYLSVAQLSPKKSSHNIAQTAQQLAENIFKSNSTTETTKYKCSITSERLAQLKKIVDDAVIEHKIFTIKGGWQIVRSALLKRGWVERFESVNTKKPNSAPTPQNLDDLCVNLPSRQAWESQKAHTEKCERTIMSRLLQIHECDFYWNMRKDQSDWQHRCSQNKLMNRFGRSLFTSKEGLCLLLQQIYWHIEPGVAQVNFPRCYVLGFPDHFNNFVEDFRLTACMGLLKWFIHKNDTSDEYLIKSPEGKVPFSCLQFAMNRLDEFIATKKHLDIDRDFPKVWDHEWEQFLTYFFRAVHHDEPFIESKEWSLSILNAAAKVTLQEVSKYWPQYHLDGMKNIWIMKPGNKCRGRGIHLIRNVEDVAKAVNMKLKYVVQKYIEKPLIIYNTKFDIRQWFMITSVQPLTIWMYRESYLRFSSQMFNLENFHESLHLTNHAVQCKYTNMTQRDKALPEENMWDCDTFKEYLKQIGHANKWEDVIFPGMRQSLIGTMLACQETMDRRPNTYELYGADFILAEDFTPWLLEINSSPDLSSSTSVTARMCPQCLEDLMKVVVDRRKDPKVDTGMFTLIYKQNLPRAPAYLGMSLSVRGRRIFKNKTKRNKTSSSTKDVDSISRKDYVAVLRPPTAPAIVQPSYTPKELSATMYDGPVIGDLMEELQTSYLNSCENGIDFVPVSKLPVKVKKKMMATKNERVSKEYGTKIKANKKRSSVNRKQKGSGKLRRQQPQQNYERPSSSTQQVSKSKTDHLGVCPEWTLKCSNSERSKGDTDAGSASILREKESVGYRKGKNVLSKFNVSNKNIFKSSHCLGAIGLSTVYGSNNNISCVIGNEVPLKTDLLTVGINLRHCQRASSK